MNELKITEQNIGQEIIQAVSARELHKALEIGRDFSSWIKPILEDFIEDLDYLVFPETGENPNGGRPSIEYAVSMDVAKHISMLSRTPKGKEIRRYFIECEKRLKEPKSMAEIALMHCQLLVKLEQEQKIINEKQASLEHAVKKITAKQTAFEEGLSYFTVLGYAAYRGITVDLSMAQKIGKEASRLSKEKDMPIDRTKDARFGMVNSYHEKILDEIIASML